jgi:hypothetical protein
MARPINDDIAYKGSTLVLGVKFPPVDDTYSFTNLLNAGNIEVYYYIINTKNKYKVDTLYKAWEEDNPDYANMYAFTVETENLVPGVLMVEVVAQIPAHNNLPERTEIARCSSGIAIME